MNEMIEAIVRMLRDADEQQVERLYYFIKGFLSRKQ